MRVSHVITRLIVGGAQENTITSVLGLADRPEFQVELLSGPTTGPEGSLEHLLASRAGTLRILPHLVRPIHPWRDLLAYRALCRHFRTKRPVLVHTHSGKAGILGRLAAARSGVPLILHTIHGPSFGPFQGRAPNALFLAAEARAALVTTKFVVVAQAMARQYLAAGIGRPGDYVTIHSGFALKPFLAASNDAGLRARFGIGPQDIVVGKIARLFKLKGHDTLFKVAPDLVRQNPAIKFLLVGDGAWRGRFQAMADSLGLRDRFVFTGLVSPEEVPALVGIMDILVHLSYREGLPRALPQAMAAGKPVVAWNCDGSGEVCLDGNTGFLVSCGDLEKLKRSVLLLAGNPDLRHRLGMAGRALARRMFDEQHMVERLAELYLDLARTHSLPARKPENE